MSSVVLLQATAHQIPLQEGSVHCLVTSPPYWHQRDYGVQGQLGAEQRHDCNGAFTGQNCGACYVCRLRAVGQECWRILRDDGTLWLVLGDSYASGWPCHRRSVVGAGSLEHGNRAMRPSMLFGGLKEKDLCMIPARVALALQADGWVLRSAITWCKKSPLPESVRDRPTSATEMIFLFAKQPRYFYDAEAVREYGGNGWHGSSFTSSYDVETKPGLGMAARPERPGHNLWNYWIVGPEPFQGPHYAAFPTALVARCIKAGSSEAGCCPQCQAPYVREVERYRTHNGVRDDSLGAWRNTDPGSPRGAQGDGHWRYASVSETKGFSPSCPCIPDALGRRLPGSEYMDWLTTPRPCTIFDPFVGSGTTVLTARALGRHGLGMDLSRPYLTLAQERLGLTALRAWEHGGPPRAETYTDLPLFAQEESLDGCDHDI